MVAQTLQDPVSKYSTTPLSDPNFDFEAWKARHLTASEEVAARWVNSVKARYGTTEDVKVACVGYWWVLHPEVSETKADVPAISWGVRFACQQLSAEGICKAGGIAQFRS